jgi:hypothetical protein
MLPSLLGGARITLVALTLLGASRARGTLGKPA